MIDKKTALQVAHLARLKISDEEAESIAQQLSKVLGHFEEISKIDTKGIEPLVTPSEIESYWRPDQFEKEFSAEEMVSNAPDRAGQLFRVPPVV